MWAVVRASAFALAVFGALFLQLLLSIHKRCCHQWNTNGTTLCVWPCYPHLSIKLIPPSHESTDFSLAAIPNRNEPRRMSLFCVFALHGVTVAQSVAQSQTGAIELHVTH